MLFSRTSVSFYLLLLLVITLPVASAADKIVVSPNDNSVYRALELDNKLRVLLISDPEADKAAASMNVAVGSAANPKNIPGLAHFLEHMLFLGTEKYPKADEYQSFIRSHGGSHNAYTSMENTNYFFDVGQEHLEPALDRFAQFFIAPLFNEKYVDRERHAVHSEYKAKIRDDYRRSYAATKMVLNPHHSYSQFAVGNLKTLSDQPEQTLQQALLDFYDRYYSANLMTLVIKSRHSLDHLEKLSKQLFSPIRNIQRSSFNETNKLFPTGALPLKLEIKTLKEQRHLSLTFPTSEFRSHWQKKPLYYLANLIGYEGTGSLLSLLKREGLATGLSASPGYDLKNEAAFLVSIQLTPEGEKEYQTVTRYLFQYIHLLKQKGVTEALYNEIKQQNEIAFRFQEKQEAIHAVSYLSRQMRYIPVEQVLVADYRLKDFDPTLIHSYLELMNPENMLLTLKSPTIEGDKVEHYYRTSYSIKPLTDQEVKAYTNPSLHTDLTVKKLNPFITSELELLASNSDQAKPEPVTLQQDYQLWHQQDSSFSTPKSNIFFSLQTPEANRSVENWIKTKLFIELINEQLNETLYDAYLADLSAKIYPHMKGFTVRLSGYSAALPKLQQAIIKGLKNLKHDTAQFEIVRQQFIDDLHNKKREKPYDQTISKLYQRLLPQWEDSEQLEVLEKATFEQIQNFAEESLLNNIQLKVLIHGNSNRADAKKIGSELKLALIKAANKSQNSEVKVVQIPENSQWLERIKLDHKDTAISLLLQGSNNKIQHRAEVAVLSEILAAPFYNLLRTEKQLGYIVFATPLQMHKTPGLGFIIQSPTASANQLQQEVSLFIETWQTKLATINQQELERYKQSVISRILTRDNNLGSRTKRYWRELDWHETDFNSREKLAEAVAKLNLRQLQHCMDTLRKRQLTVTTSAEDKTTKPDRLTVKQEVEQLRRQKHFVPEQG